MAMALATVRQSAISCSPKARRRRRAQEEHPHRAPFVQDRQERERANVRAWQIVAHDARGADGSRIGDDERLARWRAPAGSRDTVREVDRQIAKVLVVATRRRRSRRLLARARGRCCTLDLRHLGDAPDDGEEDVAKIEVRRERLGQLEDDLGVPLFARELLHVLADPQLAADARHELGRAERLAHEVVGPGLEGARHLVVCVERGEHHHRDIARPGRARMRRVSRSRRGGHHQIEEHQRGELLGIRASASAPESATVTRGRRATACRVRGADGCRRRRPGRDRALVTDPRLARIFSISTTGAAFGSGPLGPSPCAPETRSRHAVAIAARRCMGSFASSVVRVGMAAPINTC